ncbi:MAG: hypothetical protein K2J77_03685 [Oscillospiraceae bacterium]|nr:hypothetical protein [Oscillospiraceae bacterium]
MNNKDLFNAINDIDEKFIEDAGKYLNDDDADLLHSGAVEIYPGETRFSPMKLIASIAAAAVFITGVSIAFNHYRGKIFVDPNTGEEVSLGGSTGVSDGNSGTDIGTHAPKTVGPLPFEVIGPDDRQLWYEDIIGAVGLDGETLRKEDLTEDNWQSLNCDFAYIAVPDGYNYNTVDNSPVEINSKADDSLTHDFMRIHNGGVYGDLTVMSAYSTISRLDDESDNSIAVLSKNHIEFSGEITADVYLVNDNGKYYCVFRNGEAQLPIFGYDIYEYLKLGEYTTDLQTLKCENGFQYVGEMPVLTLDENEIYTCGRALENSNYLKATATFDNISIESSQTLGSNSYTYNASMAKVTLSYVDTDEETPFDEETEMELRAILGSAEDISELKNNAEVMSLSGCSDIRVYKGIDPDGNLGEEVYNGKLVSGNRNNTSIIVLYSNGKQIAAYDYLVYNLTRKD